MHVKHGQGGSEPLDATAFYKGDMKSWWDKYVPANVAAKISTMVTDQLTAMQKKLDNQELSLQKEITRLKTEANSSDEERLKVLNNLRNAKKKLTDQQLQEDLRHNYIYHIILDRNHIIVVKLVSKTNPLRNQFMYSLRSSSRNLCQS